MYKNKRPYKQNYIPNSQKKLSKVTPTIPKYLYPDKEVVKDLEETIDIKFLLEKLKTRQEIFDEKLKQYESTQLQYFIPETNDLDNLLYVRNFLYHGIRFRNDIEKLENIFKTRTILAGNYHDKYYSYDDNCNEGEYISLTSFETKDYSTYQIFIMLNISLIISPECNAIKTIYLEYEDWEKLKGIETKNRYSYATNEYQVKHQIPLELVKAIGLPAKQLKAIKREYQITEYLNQIIYLMEKYDIYLPIVDTSNYNQILYLPAKNNSKPKQKKLKLEN